MPSLLLSAGAVGFLIVALGAFGAHGLEERLSEEAKDWWATATLYGLGHAVAALAIALAPNAHPTTKEVEPSFARLRARAGAAFLIGAAIFSGSLYAMALGAPAWFGAITPVGGVSFLIGWALVIVHGMRRS